MRNENMAIMAVILAVIAVLAFSSIASAQGAPPPEGWRTCPRCQGGEDRAAAVQAVADRSFDPQDLSGIWGFNGVELDVYAVPPLTPYGKQLYDSTRSDEAPDGTPISNSKDGMLICDPLGYPRLFAYNYGFEFAHMSDRLVQFFEWGHTWRDIWTDGRELPADPPAPRWMGWAVGRWEGDTFVIESNGYDDRSWLSEDRRDRRWGFPHTDELRVVERYRRTGYTTLEASLTIIDPQVYKTSWTTEATIRMSADTELWEYMCAPSESELFNEQYLRPAAGAIP